MLLRRISVLALAALALAASAQAQVIWGGGFPNDQYSYGTNWYGGAVPVNGDSIQINDNSDSFLNINVAGVSLSGITITSSSAGGGAYIEIVGGGNSLTLGSGGVVATSDGSNYDSSQIEFGLPLVLSANQTWSQLDNPNGYIQADKKITGAFSLTLAGDGVTPATFILSLGSSTFSGGLTLSGQYAALAVGSSSSGPAGAPTSGPVGTGTLSLNDGTTLTTSTNSTVTLANPVVVGNQSSNEYDGITFGGPAGSFNSGGTSLVLTGPITLDDADVEVDVGQNSAVTLAGAVTGFQSGICLDVGTGNWGWASNGYLIIQGNISNVDRVDLLDSVSVILDGAGFSQVSGLGDIGGDGSHVYLGLGSGYIASSGVESFISFMNASYSAGGFAGTIGLDTTSGPTATFTNAVDLTGFTSGNFVGLGSATSAILTGTITPPGGATGTNFPFGGGGGTLTVTSNLGDGFNGETGVPRSLTLEQGNAPLTLVLSGVLTYSNSTYINGGALIFNTPPPMYGQINLNSGYVGVTASALYVGSEQNFINLFTSIPETTGVIGFDSLTGQYVVPNTSSINMSALNSGVYLGTATSVNYGGPITPYGSTYQFAGVKGGQVTVSSALTGANAVAVGLPYPVESFNPLTGYLSQSTVTLSNPGNSYSGGTILNSGYLDVTNANSLGSGPLTVPDAPGGGNNWVGTLAASGGPVSLSNNIYVPNGGLALNTGSSYLLTLTGTISNYINGDVTDNGQLGIFGPADIEGYNTYSGGTVISTNGSTVTVGTNTGLGTGQVNVSDTVINFTGSAPVLGSASNSQGQQVYLTNETVATFSGNASIYGLVLENSSTLNLNGLGTYIAGLNDPPNSGSIINLGAGSVLTVDVNDQDGGGSTYHGVINGSTGSLVVINSSDGGGFESLDLRNVNTYGGGTSIAANALVIASNNSALGTGGVTIEAGGGLVTNTGVVLTNPITLVNGGGLAGFGTFSPGGTLAIQGGSIIDPGSGGLQHGGGGGSQVPFPGTLTFAGGTSLTFGGGGQLLFSLTDANGAAGVGYGSVALGTGALTITATPGSPFAIDLYTFNASADAAGLALNFNPALPYTWTILTAASITNFSASDFTFNLGNFQNSIGSGMFYLTESGGTSLLLNFTPVPEPSTWALMASGLFAVGAAVRRRRR